MHVRRCRDADELYRRAERFLLAHEAHHNVIFGICAGLSQSSATGPQEPYLAAVERAGEVVAVALMTPPRDLVLSLVAAPGALALLADDLHAQHPTLPGVVGPVPVSRDFAARWRARSGQRYRPGGVHRGYQLDAAPAAPAVPGELRPATAADRGVVGAWLAALNRELGDDEDRLAARLAEAESPTATNGLYLWHDGQPVSMAGYSGPTPNGIRVGSVYTPPELRGKGYARACVAALSRHLLAGGRRYCFLSTDLRNPITNHLYQSVGYRPVYDVEEYRFR
ncbi:MAG TPA: GNAT family N-acetyltransferase [Thermomicrobiales bacterium]|nr:GNAT family N-acetyltransferase [Thermomicrobiales bacterium]